MRTACKNEVQEAEGKLLDALERRETRSSDGKRYKIEDVDGMWAAVKKFFDRRRAPPKSKPKRVGADLANIQAKGINLDLIRQGQNPFTNPLEYEYLRRAVDYMLAVRCFTPSDIAEEYFRQTGDDWKATTRASNASKAVRILAEAGVITKEGKVYCLS